MQKKYRWDCIMSRVPIDVPIIGAEIGVWRGKNAAMLLSYLPKLTLHLIDRWIAPPVDDSYYFSGSEIARSDQALYDDAKRETKEKLKWYDSRAVIWEEDSATASMHFPVQYFDFVFIDSDHSYAGVKKAIAEWMGKVKPGGFIGFHDYGHPDQGEVKKAVDEAFPHVETDANNTAFVRIA